jgi:L-malate glycosyltransferase
MPVRRIGDSALVLGDDGPMGRTGGSSTTWIAVSKEARLNRPTVAIVGTTILHYRVPFFEGLRAALHDLDVELEVIAAEKPPPSLERAGNASLAWSTRVPTKYFCMTGREVSLQRVIGRTRHCQLVIVEQATRHLANYPILARQFGGHQRVAFWGHGQSITSPRLSEALKQVMSRRVHWWFAYNERSARIVRKLGYPAERMTVVNNAIDTQALAQACAKITSSELDDLRRKLHIEGENVAVFIGVLNRAKDLPFLLRAARTVREQIPDFELIVVGDGPDRPLLDDAAGRYPWIHTVGAHFGVAVAPYLRLARLTLLPGAVGLGVVDSLVAGCPMITRAVPDHRPEIDYLKPGVNGVMVSSLDETSYARAIVRVLSDEVERQGLIDGCRSSAVELSMDQMVERFAGGVAAALAHPLARTFAAASSGL